VKAIRWRTPKSLSTLGWGRPEQVSERRLNASVNVKSRYTVRRRAVNRVVIRRVNDRGEHTSENDGLSYFAAWIAAADRGRKKGGPVAEAADPSLSPTYATMR